MSRRSGPGGRLRPAPRPHRVATRVEPGRPTGLVIPREPGLELPPPPDHIGLGAGHPRRDDGAAPELQGLDDGPSFDAAEADTPTPADNDRRADAIEHASSQPADPGAALLAAAAPGSAGHAFPADESRVFEGEDDAAADRQDGLPAVGPTASPTSDSPAAISPAVAGPPPPSPNVFRAAVRRDGNAARPGGNGFAPSGQGNATRPPPVTPPERLAGVPSCTSPQLRRFIKSRAYVPMHELRRRFAIEGEDDDVTAVDVGRGRIYVGLPSVEGRLLGDLLRGGEIGFELSVDPETPIVIGVYAMRPVPRS